MNRKISVALVFLLFFSSALLFPGGKREVDVRPVVTVWAYDSFVSEWGPGPEITRRFEEETGMRLRLVSHGDSGTVLSRLLLEGSSAGADVILGIDQNSMDRLLATELLEAYRPENAGALFDEIIMDRDFRLIPYDYSYFAFVYDSELMPEPPQSLEELSDGKYRRSIILMDPRTSSPGLGFLAWTKAVYGEGWLDYWRRLAPSVLTIAEGWSSGYGLFTAGEAPLVLSYTTSPGYHLEYEETERFKTAIFPGGHPLQVEMGGLLAAGPNKEGGRKFLDFMLSPSFQEVIPLTNWMYPATGIALPDSYRINPKSDRVIPTEGLSSADLNEWAALMSSLPR